MSAAAVIVGLVSVPYVVETLLADLNGGFFWVTAVFAVALLLPFVLFILAVIRPRSVGAAVGPALLVGFLLIAGMGAPPMSLPRILVHLAAILCLAALLTQVIRGVAEGQRRALWIVPALLLGVPIGFLAAAATGLHIWTQWCGNEVLSYLCSG